MLNKIKKCGKGTLDMIYRCCLVIALGFFFTVGSITAFNWFGINVGIAHYQEPTE